MLVGDSRVHVSIASQKTTPGKAQCPKDSRGVRAPTRINLFSNSRLALRAFVFFKTKKDFRVKKK